MDEQIGPVQQNIPAKTYMSCWGCKFFDHHMVMSGRHPKYANNCLHTDIPDAYKFRGMFTGNLGDAKETPNWCPVLKPKILNPQ